MIWILRYYNQVADTIAKCIINDLVEVSFQIHEHLQNIFNLITYDWIISDIVEGYFQIHEFS